MKECVLARKWERAYEKNGGNLAWGNCCWALIWCFPANFQREKKEKARERLARKECFFSFHAQWLFPEPEWPKKYSPFDAQIWRWKTMQFILEPLRAWPKIFRLFCKENTNVETSLRTWLVFCLDSTPKTWKVKL